MNILSEPVVHLLRIRRQRRGECYPSFTLLLCCFAIPLLVFGLMVGHEPHNTLARADCLISIQVFLAVVSTLILAVLPFYAVASQVSLLNSLLKGRCLEEMLTAGIAPSQMTDTLALSGYSRFARFAGQTWILLVLGLVLFRVPANFCCQLFLGVWPLLVPALVVWLSYLALAGLLVLPRRNRSTALYALSCMATVISLGAWLAFGSYGMMAFLLCLLWLPLLSRTLAIRALADPCTLNLRAKARKRRPSSFNLSLASYSDNLIVRRELARRRFSLFGLAGLLILLFPFAGILIAPSSCRSEFLMLGPPLLSLLGFLRGASTTLNAVTQERQQKTWESLAESGVSLDEFRDGWLLLGTIPGCLESLPSIFGFILLLAGPAVPMWVAALFALMAWVLLAFFIQVGAQVGLSISAESPDLQRAGLSLLRVTCLGSLSVLLLCGIFWSLGGTLLPDLPRWVQENWGPICWSALPWLSAIMVAGGLQNWSERELERFLSVGELDHRRQTGAGYRPLFMGSFLATWPIMHLLRSHFAHLPHWYLGTLLLAGVAWLVVPWVLHKLSRHWQSPLATFAKSTTAAVATAFILGAQFLRLWSYHCAWSNCSSNDKMLSILTAAFLVGILWGTLELTILRCIDGWTARR